VEFPRPPPRAPPRGGARPASPAPRREYDLKNDIMRLEAGF
jgi:hypothetical protein